MLMRIWTNHLTRNQMSQITEKIEEKENVNTSGLDNVLL